MVGIGQNAASATKKSSMGLIFTPFMYHNYLYLFSHFLIDLTFVCVVLCSRTVGSFPLFLFFFRSRSRLSSRLKKARDEEKRNPTRTTPTDTTHKTNKADTHTHTTIQTHRFIHRHIVRTHTHTHAETHIPPSVVDPSFCVNRRWSASPHLCCADPRHAAHHMTHKRINTHRGASLLHHRCVGWSTMVGDGVPPLSIS